MTASSEGFKKWDLIEGWEKVPELHKDNKVGDTVRCGRRLFTVEAFDPFERFDYISGTNPDHAFRLRCKSNGEVIRTQSYD